jgi:hypothetical protein
MTRAQRTSGMPSRTRRSRANLADPFRSSDPGTKYAEIMKKKPIMKHWSRAATRVRTAALIESAEGSRMYQSPTAPYVIAR